MSQQKKNRIDVKVHPPRLFPAYKSTVLRAPARPLIFSKKTFSELTGPAFGSFQVDPLDSDLTKNSVVNGVPLGERIVVHGKVMDEFGRAIPHTLVEIWQANAAGRYVHKIDQHDAPLDPNFLGAGRCLTDATGNYKFYSIKPGAYPWGNHDNAWRPQHIHFSLFGVNITSRLITQMYFPGDPLLELDPIFKGVPERGRKLLIADFDIDITEPSFALGYRFDIILKGNHETPFENK
ncbi:MAG: protocatechuate 3,4-dioxygenase subunit beta [Saprospiraceae bacterium]|nr:protocatechuate 3,4-dioxygenase subunit beta [Saprospiraceae bacterium]